MCSRNEGLLIFLLETASHIKRYINGEVQGHNSCTVDTWIMLTRSDVLENLKGAHESWYICTTQHGARERVWLWFWELYSCILTYPGASALLHAASWLRHLCMKLPSAQSHMLQVAVLHHISLVMKLLHEE